MSTHSSSDIRLSRDFSGILRDLSRFQSSRQYTDVEFLCGDVRVAAHRAVLAPLSSFLGSLFEASFKYQAADVVFISLPDVDSSGLIKVLSYIYEGGVDNNRGNASVHAVETAVRILQLDVDIGSQATNDQQELNPSIEREKGGKELGRKEKSTRKAKRRQVYDENYEVEKIVDKRIMFGQIEYFVKWKGWGIEDNTWEPQEHLEEVHSLIEVFEKREERKQNGRKTRTSIRFSPDIGHANNVSARSEGKRKRGRPKKVSLALDLPLNVSTAGEAPKGRRRSKHAASSKRASRGHLRVNEVGDGEIEELFHEDDAEVEERKPSKRKKAMKQKHSVKKKENGTLPESKVDEDPETLGADDDEVSICEREHCQRVFTSRKAFMNHQTEEHGEI